MDGWMHGCMDAWMDGWMDGLAIKLRRVLGCPSQKDRCAAQMKKPPSKSSTNMYNDIANRYASLLSFISSSCSLKILFAYWPTHLWYTLMSDLFLLYFLCGRVTSLAWDDASDTLFVGGLFHAVGDAPITSGLAIWTRHKGLSSFPGGGLSLTEDSGHYASVKKIAFESQSGSLFVSGTFANVNGHPCKSIAVWHRYE